MLKLCSYCSGPGRYSLVFVLSSVGVSPRSQKCSPAVLLCDDCLRELCESECLCTSELQRAVNNAYTTLNQCSSEHLKARQG